MTRSGTYISQARRHAIRELLLECQVVGIGNWCMEVVWIEFGHLKCVRKHLGRRKWLGERKGVCHRSYRAAGAIRIAEGATAIRTRSGTVHAWIGQRD